MISDCITELENWDDEGGLLYNYFLSLPLLTVLYDQEIRATRPAREDDITKELNVNKKNIKTEVRGTIKSRYEKKSKGIFLELF